MNTDALRAAIGELVRNFFGMLVLLSLLDLTTEQLAGINVFVGSATTLVFLVWKVKPSTTTEITMETKATE